MSDADKAAECYRRMYESMIRKDRAMLENVLDDSFVLVHMTGMRQDKEAFIQAVEDGTLNYFSASHARIDVTVDGDRARLDGRSIVAAAVFGGGRHTWRLRQVLDLIRAGGDWKITGARASTW